MSEILLTSSLTIIGGVLIFVTGKLIEVFVIIPVQKQKETIGEIADKLILFSNLYSNPSFTLIMQKEHKNAAKTVRELSSQFIARSTAIPFYTYLSRWGYVIKWDDIIAAKKELIGLSNSFVAPNDGLRATKIALQNTKRVEKICNLLNLKGIAE